MACSNGKLIRYIVGMTQGCGWDATAPTELVNDIAELGSQYIPVGTHNDIYPLDNVTKVNGINLGEEGEVEIPGWDSVGLVSDGKRKLTSFTLQVRVDEAIKGTGSITSTAGAMARLYKQRAALSVDVYVLITDRAWNVLWFYLMEDSTLKSWKQEDQELGAPKLGLVDLDFSPADVKLYGCDGQLIVGSGSSATIQPQFCS